MHYVELEQSGGPIRSSHTVGEDVVYEFGRFRLTPSRQQLLDGAEQVRLGSRALELLTALVERAGSMVDKATLMQRVWPETVVEEINLRVQVTALRKALGAGEAGARFIATTSGRGYSFVAPVKRARATGIPVADLPPNNLPRRTAMVLGRDHDVANLVARLPQRRFITVVGPGGMGKTTLAVAVGERMLKQQRDGVFFVDLAPLSDPAGVPGAIAAALRLSIGEARTLERLAETLTDREVLIVLDNCEHLVEAAALAAEHVVRSAARVSILATSREPLRAEGESIYRLHPLGLPADEDDHLITHADQALTWPAVQLFVERATANLDSFVLSNHDAATVVSMCRRLDGLPLAIELAAARVDTLGVQGLSDHLEARLHLLTSGLRTVQPRQRTLRALLDWSHDQLSSTEQVVLRRLAIFRGAFNFDEAIEVSAGEDVAAAQVMDSIVSLADRSLVSVDAGADVIYYRLLEVTRVYALEHLAARGEADRLAERHALQLLQHYERSEIDWVNLPRVVWLAQNARRTDDLRGALDWAFSATGNVELGVQLTVAVAPLAFELAVLHDFRHRLERAINALASLPGEHPADASRLYTALGSLYNHVLGPSAEMSSAYKRAYELASHRRDAKAMTPPIVGLWAQAYASGQYLKALEGANQLEALARQTQDDVALLIAQRMLSQANHMLGNHALARSLAEHVLAYPGGRFPLAYGPSQTSVQVTMRIVLARTDWLEGRADDAVRRVDEAIAIARDEHVFGECLVLAIAACPISLWCGDLDRARAFTARLVQLTQRYPSPYWHAWADGFAFALGTQGDVPPPYEAARYDSFITFMPGLIDQRSFDRAVAGETGWCAAEIMRAQALKLGKADAPAAERLLREALALARKQGAVAWELRCASSLVRFARDDRRRDAMALLADVLGRIPQGANARDAMDARALLGLPPP